MVPKWNGPKVVIVDAVAKVSAKPNQAGVFRRWVAAKQIRVGASSGAGGCMGMLA